MAGFLLSSFAIKSGPGPLDVIFNTTNAITAVSDFVWATDEGAVFNTSAKMGAQADEGWSTDVGTVFNSVLKQNAKPGNFTWSA
jgi:hypothetical protein